MAGAVPEPSREEDARLREEDARLREEDARLRGELAATRRVLEQARREISALRAAVLTANARYAPGPPVGGRRAGAFRVPR